MVRFEGFQAFDRRVCAATRDHDQFVDERLTQDGSDNIPDVLSFVVGTDPNADRQEDRLVPAETFLSLNLPFGERDFDTTKRTNLRASSGVASLLSPARRSTNAMGTSATEYR